MKLFDICVEICIPLEMKTKTFFHKILNQRIKKFSLQNYKSFSYSQTMLKISSKNAVQMGSGLKKIKMEIKVAVFISGIFNVSNLIIK